jgi:ribosomal protein S19E (S16A)
MSFGTLDWKELSRADQKTLQRMYGGGSLRNCDPVAISRLRQSGLIEGKEGRERLSSSGWQLMDYTHAQLKARMARFDQARQ